LQGRLNEVAFTVALNNSLSKKKIEYPNFDSVFKEHKVDDVVYNELKERLDGVTDEDLRQQIEFNYWARI
jgi:hypothetical protein